MGKIKDSEAREAARTLRKYCNKHKYCQNCIFATGKMGANCLMASKLPFDWVKY